MADYKDIVGSKVTAVSSNPTNQSDGQVWYNTTDNVSVSYIHLTLPTNREV